MTHSLTVAAPALAAGFARQVSEVVLLALRAVAWRIAAPLLASRGVAWPIAAPPIVVGIILIAERRSVPQHWVPQQSVPPLTATTTMAMAITTTATTPTVTATAATRMATAIGSASSISLDRRLIARVHVGTVEKRRWQPKGRAAEKPTGIK